MRKLIYLFLSFLALTFVFAPVSYAADPNDFRKPNNWQRERTINDAVNKSSVKVEASKTYPVSTLGADGKPIKQIRNAKATVTLGASAANTGKSLFKRAPAIAITQAVIAILGKSVDWVLDPANNSVKYKDPDELVITYQCNYNGCKNTNPVRLSQLQTNFLADTGRTSLSGGVFDLRGTHQPGSSTQSVWYLVGGATHNVGASVGDFIIDTDYKHIPIADVANEIARQADDGYAPAMQVMNDAALDALEAGLLDAQLDAASDIPQPDPQEITQAQYDNPDYPEVGSGTGTGPETPVDPETPTDPVDPNPNPNPDAKPFELPPFCSWASKVCDFIDWVQTEPPEPPESGEVDVQIPDSNMHEGILERLYINMPAQCPPDPILEFMGAKIPFPMSIFCQFAEMMKPLILLFAYIKGLSIIGNGLT